MTVYIGLDMAYAALSAAVEPKKGEPLRMPRKISGTGGKWYFDDDQEWPDTMQVSYEYPGKPPQVLTWMKCVFGLRTIIWVRWKGALCLVTRGTSLSGTTVGVPMSAAAN